MRRRRTTSAVHADRMIPKLLKNMPGINAVFFLFYIFLISAALTIFVNQTVYAETYTVIIRPWRYTDGDRGGYHLYDREARDHLQPAGLAGGRQYPVRRFYGDHRDGSMAPSRTMGTVLCPFRGTMGTVLCPFRETMGTVHSSSRVTSVAGTEEWLLSSCGTGARTNLICEIKLRLQIVYYEMLPLHKQAIIIILHMRAPLLIGPAYLRAPA